MGLSGRAKAAINASIRAAIEQMPVHAVADVIGPKI
jgi:hypothetical protein